MRSDGPSPQKSAAEAALASYPAAWDQPRRGSRSPRMMVKEKQERVRERRRERELPARLKRLRDTYVRELLSGSPQVKNFYFRGGSDASFGANDLVLARHAMAWLTGRPFGTWYIMHLTGGLDLLDLATVMGLPLDETTAAVGLVRADLHSKIAMARRATRE